ncbi:MAG: type II toxin-antitoxin system RelE/ParE family toxin [Hyphomonadaceae bacterium]|nr:type II toxin-antitoxin system RelE/ParE family toxin [Hyphomonadaceae bacterium]
MTKKRRTVRLGGEAERDFAAILAWTEDQFGRQQASTYKTTLWQAIRAIAADPFCVGSKSRDADVGPNFRTLHVARAGRKGRHIVLYRVEGDMILILRILPDAMETSRHLPQDDDQP